MQETQAQSLGGEDPLEKETANNSSILAWEIHRQRSLAGYSPWSRKRVGQGLVTKQTNQKMDYLTNGAETAISRVRQKYSSPSSCQTQK